MKIVYPIPQNKPTKSYDRLSFRYFKDGRLVVQKWPRRRPGVLPQGQQEAVAIWDMSQEFLKDPEPGEYALAMYLTRGTAFYTRDILTMAMYGNFVSWPGWGWRERER